MKGKLFSSGLNSVIVATCVLRAVATTIATTTSIVLAIFPVLLLKS
jgi:hypothetical protein